MKKYIPWWLKIIAKIILSRMPIGYSFWQKIGLFHHGHMEESSYVLEVFNGHISMAGLEGKIQGKTILELGSGDSVATAIVAACHGARSILVDVGAFATNDMERYRKIAEDLKKKGFNVPNITKAKTLDDVLLACGSQYLTQGLESFATIETGVIDLIFSQAVLEHVRKAYFLDTMKECARVLAVDGVASHRVDLKDHLGGSLNNLRFSDRVWESDFFVQSGFYTNRIRFSKMIALFEDAGFIVDVSELRRWETLPLNQKVLSSAFSLLPESELMISGFDALLRKHS